MSEKIIIPLSILIAAIVIGGAIFLSNQANNGSAISNPNSDETTDINPVDPETDHIEGNPDADLFIIEYSDLECPFCKRYHEDVMKPLAAEYAADGRVAFVFRHFPLDAPYTRVVHATATEEAVASECVAQLGGNEAFFEFIDVIFATTNSDGRFDLGTLPSIAAGVGVDEAAFTTCYENEETKSLVTADFEDGRAGGVEGTPAIFAQSADGVTYQAVADYDVLKQAIEVFLEDNSGNNTTTVETETQTSVPAAE
jgi:protein-disulfide isomerase